MPETSAPKLGTFGSIVSMELDVPANANGTTFLRAAFLPEAHQTSLEILLRRYVDARLEFCYAGEDRAGRRRWRKGGRPSFDANCGRTLWRRAGIPPRHWSPPLSPR